MGPFIAGLWAPIVAYFAANAAAFGVRYGVPLVMAAVLAVGWATGTPWVRTEMALSAALAVIVVLEVMGKLPAFATPAK